MTRYFKSDDVYGIVKDARPDVCIVDSDGGEKWYVPAAEFDNMTARYVRVRNEVAALEVIVEMMEGK